MVELVVSFNSPAALPFLMAISRRSTALNMASRMALLKPVFITPTAKISWLKSVMMD